MQAMGKWTVAKIVCVALSRQRGLGNGQRESQLVLWWKVDSASMELNRGELACNCATCQYYILK
ncbi:hypothetical protein SLEP1_g26692 [Rubroshorea leprosula]|uniref:Uncharacterized protein n=1 Tax=Rubroshorea leprosula TaxID=152421 RepID=A0AAV5JQR6_9ROSI|nr:hypothetical protein SLEP1_g26692 [Rubroshorea leprosula]